MTPQFRLTEAAIQDIEQIADYIARKSLFFSLLERNFVCIVAVETAEFYFHN